MKTVQALELCLFPKSIFHCCTNKKAQCASKLSNWHMCNTPGMAKGIKLKLHRNVEEDAEPSQK